MTRCSHYGLRIGLRHARKHLGWALDVAADAAGAPAARSRPGAQRILTSEDPAGVHRSLPMHFDDFAWSAAA
jgi:tRNA-dihydrouridine synthase B